MKQGSDHPRQIAIITKRGCFGHFGEIPSLDDQEMGNLGGLVAKVCPATYVYMNIEPK